ncbi:hypothetical protein [Lutibacter sp.]
MIITENKDYTLVKPSQNSVEEFYHEFKNKYLDFNNKHLIIDFSEKFNTTIKEILLFLTLSEQHKKNGTSFVIVSKDVDIDSLPEELNVVPTLTEALDILEMDAIERDLGF